MQTLPDIPADRPVLLAGPTASGKSALALALAEAQGGVIVNADASQVYDNWRVLTARPGADKTARAPHALYGHVAPDEDYSAGHWLREVGALLGRRAPRPIVTGGTGLYFRALTEGLADIPPVPPEIRAEGESLLAQRGPGALLAQLDAATARVIDRANPRRLLRGWEVLRATGRGLADWQAETPPPLLPAADCTCLVVAAPATWLEARITRRLDAMLSAGALDEVRANLPGWDDARPAFRAIGARELAAYLRGECTLADARAATITATRQFAKRQRTWFRARMRTWHWLPAAEFSNFRYLLSE